MLKTTLLNNQRLAALAGVDYKTEKIIEGPIVYSRTHTIRRQFRKLATFDPCILITSFSDKCVTQDMANCLPKNVKRWYSNNVDCNDPRVIGVPIGFVYNSEREQHLLDAVHQDKEGLLYVNFTRSPKARIGLYEMFSGQDWVTLKGGNSFADIPAPEYYADLSSHYYVLSPPGAGPDCHRHWETIYMGSVPIVLRHQAAILEGCPHLAVDDWSQVTKKLLRSDHQIPSYNCVDRMTIDYWAERIRNEVS